MPRKKPEPESSGPGPDSSRPGPETSEHKVNGHSVRIVRAADHEELWIDGTRRRFFRNSGGYVLAENAYVPARESLLDAARDYLSQTERARPDKPAGER